MILHVSKWKTSRCHTVRDCTQPESAWCVGRGFLGYLILRFFPNRKHSQNIVPANNSNNKVYLFSSYTHTIRSWNWGTFASVEEALLKHTRLQDQLYVCHSGDSQEQENVRQNTTCTECLLATCSYFWRFFNFFFSNLNNNTVTVIMFQDFWEQLSFC